MTTRTLGQLGVAAFTGRGIDAETAVKLGIYTARRDDESGEIKPDPGGNIVVFPFVEHGAEVARKYRAPGKKFWQETGGRRTFWNADVLDDPALEDGRQALIITEGEIDALTAIDCGFPFTVSVPDGAPSVPEGQDPEKLDPLDGGQEQSGKFEFMFNNRDRLKRIKRFIIAVDNDPPGKRLAAELVRRLSPARCRFVTYPAEAASGKKAAKDLNDVLMQFGRDCVARVLNEAKPYPVRGLYRLSEYPEQPEIETFPTGFDNWSRWLKLFFGEFVVITGVPSHGKSTFAINLLHSLAVTHNWRAAIFSPEMQAVPILRDRFRRLFLNRRPMALEQSEKARADKWIDQHFLFIDADPTGTGEEDEPFDLDWIIERATDAVLRDGIRVLLIDPWNEIEHARGRNESVPDYIARGIRALKRFGRLYGVIVIVLAHPTKDVNKDGKQRIPNLYDIDGAAHWFNKCDHGMVVERPGQEENIANVHLLKVRLDETGRRAKLTMSFEPETGRLTSLEETKL